jgi:hypothetical protein
MAPLRSRTAVSQSRCSRSSSISDGKCHGKSCS